jgi:dTDP-4-amino-4,6-dideoxygalactose transaminase
MTNNLKNIPMLDLKLEYEYMKEDIDSAIRQCLEHQKWILGPEVKELEDKIAEYISVKHCIGCSSGTDALVLSLRALSIKLKGQEYFDKSDEIITTPFTFTATGDAILRAGATPVFVDIDPKTYNIDPVKIKEYLSHSRSPIAHDLSKVVGIIPVHLYGQSCQMVEIMEIAKDNNLFVIEDVAQAFGGTWKGKKLGSIGTVGTFSFFPSKNFGGFGDGGMVATSDGEIAELVHMLLKHGGKDKYNVDHIGYNARLDTLQAAILLAKFKYIEEFNERRRKIAEIYSRELKDLDGLVVPMTYNPLPIATIYNIFHQYTIRVLNDKRDELQKYLHENGISTMVYYPTPLHKMKVFVGRCRAQKDLVESEKAVSEVLSLPIEPLMDDKVVFEVMKNIKKFFRKENLQYSRTKSPTLSA